jgi:hypothetical protein
MRGEEKDTRSEKVGVGYRGEKDQGLVGSKQGGSSEKRNQTMQRWQERNRTEIGERGRKGMWGQKYLI